MTDERTDGGHVVEWLDAWRTGELDSRRARAVERHLATCPECHRALEELDAFASTVEAGYRASEAARPEPDWGARRAAIVERTSGRRTSRSRWIVRWAPQVAIVAIAAVAIGVLVEKGVRGPDDVERALRAPSAERRAGAEPEDAERQEADGAGVAETAVDAAAGERPGEPVPRRPSDAAAPPPAEAEAPPSAPDAEAGAERAAAAREAAPDRAERFRSNAVAALESSDTTAAREALAFWADSVDPTGVGRARRARLEALADSLAAFLAAVP